MKKLNFDEALERINDGRRVDPKEVQARALSRKVWLAEWHLPGCLSESWSVCLTKEEAVQAGADFADGTNCRGIKKALREQGSFQHKTKMFGRVITIIKKLTLGDLL